jgi:phosphoribosyl 1,2-cyclic phosphodiesterase
LPRNFELHVLASGSDGNCAVVRADGVTLMIDAGLSGRTLERLMALAGIDFREIDALLLTHEHSDHVKGAGVISRRHGLPIYANAATFQGAGLGSVHSWVETYTLGGFSIGDLKITPLPIHHHAADPNAFAFRLGNRRCLVATDLGKVGPTIQREVERSDIIMIESNHDERMLMNGTYPPFLKELIRGERGHLSNTDCAKALSRPAKEGRKVFLAHLSKNNNTPGLALRTVHPFLGDGEEICCLEEDGEVRTLSL